MRLIAEPLPPPDAAAAGAPASRGRAGVDGHKGGQAARRLGRDVKRVHENVRALLAAGILDRTYDGQMVFPRDAAPVNFVPSVGDGRG